MSRIASPEGGLVAVTGGAGFIGASLVRRLLAGGFAVRVLDNLATGDARRLEELEVELLEGDITSYEAVEEAFGGAVAVVHLAALGSVVNSVADPAANFEVNVRGSFNVLRAAVSSGVGKVVLASTGGALVGDAELPVTERTLPKPISPYGAGKLAMEGYAHAFARSYGLTTVCLRFANVYGPFMELKRGAVTTFFRCLHDGDPITIYGDGSSSRDYLNVVDIVEAIAAALGREVEGGTVLQLSSGEETSVSRLAQLCCEVAGRPDHPIAYAEARPGEVERNVGSAALAAETIGFRPTVSLEDGLRGTWQWFEKNVFGSS